MRLKPFYLTARLQTDRQTDRRTDGQGDSSIPPPNFVAGGIIIVNMGKYQIFIDFTLFTGIYSWILYSLFALCFQDLLLIRLKYWIFPRLLNTVYWKFFAWV